MKIAYIIYSGVVKYEAANGFNEYTDVLPYLQNKGLDITSEVWDDPNVDWTKYQVALLKTPWDYHEKFDAFNSWLNKMESLCIHLLNSYEIVRWNMDKHYLEDIITSGLEVIPSVFLKKNWKDDLNALFEQLNTENIIIKPCISGGSKHTITIHKTDAVPAYDKVIQLLAKGDFIVQPLMKEVENGERSYIFFNNHFSHAILKKPKKGDFRVQQIFGGTIETLEPTSSEIKHASQYAERFAKDTLYARVDGLMVNGRFVLMELELIEPFLYLSYGEHAMENNYQALSGRLNKFKVAKPYSHN